MLHETHPGYTLEDKSVWFFMVHLDTLMARRFRAAGCPYCGGKLDVANYPRAAHGLELSRSIDAKRFSFCCRVCRRRATPPSVLYFGRRWRISVLFLSVCERILQGKRVNLTHFSQQSGIPLATLRRWRKWWRKRFPRTAQWRVRQSELLRPGGVPPLLHLMSVMRGGSWCERLLRVARWLRPWTSRFMLFNGKTVYAESESAA